MLNKINKKRHVENSYQFWFNLFYCLICTSAIFGGEYTGMLVGLTYIEFLSISKFRKFDWITKLCVVGCIISILSILTLLFVHWDVLLSGRGAPSETLKAVGWFGVAFMMIDAIRFQVIYHKISIVNFSKWLLCTAIIAVPVKVVYAMLFYDFSINEYFQFNDRAIQFLDLNPNYADEVIIIHIIVILWSMAALKKEFKQHKVLYLLGSITVMFLTICLFDANSRAAYLGLLSAFLLFSPTLITKSTDRKKLASIALITAVFVAIFATIFYSQIALRLNDTFNQISFIKSHRIHEKNNKYLHQKQYAELKNEVLGVLNNTPEGESVKQAMNNVCSSHLITVHPNNTNDDADTEFKNPSYRYLLYEDAIEIINLKPIFGFGSYDKNKIISETSNVNACRIVFFTDLHNHYIDVIVRGGFFTFTIFVILSLFIFIFIYSTFKYNKNNFTMNFLIAVFFIYLYVQSLAGVAFYKKAELSAALFAAIVLLSLNLSQNREETD